YVLRDNRVHARKCRERNGDVGDRTDVGTDETWWADADDRRGRPVQRQYLADGGRAARELPLPVPVTDYCRKRRTALVVLACQQASGRRRQTQHLVVVAGDERARDSGDAVAGSGSEAIPAEA